MDGSISLPSVYKYFSSRPVIIGSILSIRRKLVAGILGKEAVRTITYRYKHIDQLRKYKKEHKGKNKPESCKSLVKRMIRGGPQPYYYDYEPGEHITIDSVTALFRMKYGFKPPTELLPFSYKTGAIYKKDSKQKDVRSRIIKQTGNINIKAPKFKTKELNNVKRMPSLNLSQLENDVEDDDENTNMYVEIMKLPVIKPSNIPKN